MAKFKTLQDIVNHINGNKGKLRMAKTEGVWKKGDMLQFNAGTAYVSGAQVYANLSSNNAAYVLTCASVETSIQTKQEIEDELAAKKVDISILESKLKYIEETGVDAFDETEFKVWNTLTVVDNKKLSKLEKARAIAQLIGV